jgi:single-strand DNA-binding protein
MVNQVILVGRLGKDPEVRYTQSGNAVTSLRLATSKKWTDAKGQRQEKTEWHSIVVWGKSAEFCAQYLKKGSLVFVEGEIIYRQWQARDGTTKYVTEINASEVQSLGEKQKQEAASEPVSAPAIDAAYTPSFTEEDIPF